MAYVKVSTTKNAIAALRYGEHEKDVIRGGVDCPEDTEIAIKLFYADRTMWNKNSGLQAHIVIQSFDGRECSPEEANKIGQELAKKVAPGHRAMIYTHQQSEGGNIHNHIVICSVNQDDGRKLDTHGMLWKCRNVSNELTNEMGLSDITERSATIRYVQAERGLASKGEQSWKDEIRELVENAKLECSNVEEFKEYLKERGVTINERNSKREIGGKSWTYYHPNGYRVRAYKLGDNYSRSSVVQSLAQSGENFSALDQVTKKQNSEETILEKGLRMAKVGTTQKAITMPNNGIINSIVGILSSGSGIGNGKLSKDLKELLKNKTPEEIEEILDELADQAQIEGMQAGAQAILAMLQQESFQSEQEEQKRTLEKNKGFWR
jgi:hypothetical protein